MLVAILLVLSVDLVIAQSLDSLALKNYDKNIRISSENFEYQNWFDEKHSLPEGIYYQFVRKIVIENGERTNIHLPVRNPEKFFGFLLAFGITLEEAWYRQQESNCRGFDVGVYSSLLIRVEQKASDEFMEKLGFVHTNHPSVGDCPDRVQHYVFK